MKLSFHGADQGVTGSCHLLECAGKQVLIDCGMYQGDREIAEENSEPFGFDPAAIDYLLLTHAHLDHCGRIPLLARRGFKGEVITTAASVELARPVMLDSAGLQEEEARYQLRKAGVAKGAVTSILNRFIPSWMRSIASNSLAVGPATINPSWWHPVFEPPLSMLDIFSVRQVFFCNSRKTVGIS